MSCLQVPATPAFNPYPRLVQVGEFEVATDGGIWVAIRVGARRTFLIASPIKSLAGGRSTSYELKRLID